MYLPAFTLAQPRTLAEAVALAAAPEARVLAGGTGLVPNLRLGIGAPRTLVSLEHLEDLKRIGRFDGGMRIGAGVSLSDLSQDDFIFESYRGLSEAARSVAAPGHRSVATLGGNLCLDTRCLYYNQSEPWRRSNGYCLKLGGDTCHVAPQGRKCRAAYSGDLAPALLALNAQVEVAGPGGLKTIALQELHCDDGAKHLALERGEIVAAVLLPAPLGRSGYEKARFRGAIDFPLAGVAAALAVEAGRVVHLRVALTGVNSRPLLLDGTQALVGTRAGELAAAVAKLAQKQAGPMRTTTVPADYRRQAAAALAARLLARLSPGEIRQGETP
jgi:4-hydroxybenzoyl-CoA reductase subunit beta